MKKVIRNYRSKQLLYHNRYNYPVGMSNIDIILHGSNRTTSKAVSPSAVDYYVLC